MNHHKSRVKWPYYYLTLMLLSIATIGHAQTGVSIAVNNKGLTSLAFNGTSFLSYGDFRVNRVLMRNSSGSTFNADLTVNASVDQSLRLVTLGYSWGTVKVAYVTSGNRLTLNITTTNTSPNTIQGLFYEPMGLHFPAAVQEYDGSIPLICSNVGDPCVESMTYGSGTLVMANDDVQKPLIVGFPWALDKPANTVFPLRINTDREGMYPDRVPYVNRPIAPGASDVFQISLRFGGQGSGVPALAGDIYQSYASAYPSRLQWADRRAVGTLFLSSAAIGSATNPRGWFNDPGIDVTNAAGVANLKTRVLAFADSSIAILRSMNAQGMITWDIEGQQYPHATSYVGDPRMFATLAPEMSGIADAYFQKFKDAGFRIGVCIRPQQLTVSPDGSSAQQNDVTDPTALLISKITYAKNRWGATMFYVDSNGDPAFPIDANIFKNVAAAIPGIILIPEHKNTLYYAYTAPYAELRGGTASTPAMARAIYPRAFTFINTSDGPIDQRYSELVQSVQQGDVLMYRSWWNDPANAKVASIYGRNADTTASSITVTAPLSGSTLSGTVTLSATASDNVGVAGVQFKVDNANSGAELTAAPYTMLLDTKTLTNGTHTITAVARDAAGNTTSSNPVAVNVNNTLAAVCPDAAVGTFTGCYYGDQNFNKLQVVRNDSRINFNWSNAAPDPSMDHEHFSVRWQGVFNFDAAEYQFTATADDGIRVYVDGQLLLDGWRDQWPTTYTAVKAISAGSHLVRVDYYQGILGATAVFDWYKLGAAGTCPAPATGAFTGCYYGDQTLTNLRLVRTDPQVNFNWGNNAPDPSINHEHYSVRWQGTFNFDAAGYRFNALTDDGTRVYLDGQLILDGWRDQWPANYSTTATLTAGQHLVTVEYYQGILSATAVVSWDKL
jgi:hypothetical protein